MKHKTLLQRNLLSRMARATAIGTVGAMMVLGTAVTYAGPMGPGGYQTKPGCIFGFKQKGKKDTHGNYTCQSQVVKCAKRGMKLFAQFNPSTQRFEYTCAYPPP